MINSFPGHGSGVVIAAAIVLILLIVYFAFGDAIAEKYGLPKLSRARRRRRRQSREYLGEDGDILKELMKK